MSVHLENVFCALQNQKLQLKSKTKDKTFLRETTEIETTEI